MSLSHYLSVIPFDLSCDSLLLVSLSVVLNKEGWIPSIVGFVVYDFHVPRTRLPQLAPNVGPGLLNLQPGFCHVGK